MIRLKRFVFFVLLTEKCVTNTFAKRYEWGELVFSNYRHHTEISIAKNETVCLLRTASFLLLCSKKKMKRQKCRFIEPSFYVCA